MLLGANLGNQKATLLKGIEKVAALSVSPPLLSPFYRSEPWGFNQEVPHFLNVALKIEVENSLSSIELLKSLLEIEEQLGRVRSKNDHNYQSRTIDIDLLFYGDEILDTPFLTLPHPRLAYRRFVLLPLNAIAPNLIHPIYKKSVGQLLKECPDNSQVIQLT